MSGNNGANTTATGSNDLDQSKIKMQEYLKLLDERFQAANTDNSSLPNLLGNIASAYPGATDSQRSEIMALIDARIAKIEGALRHCLLHTLNAEHGTESVPIKSQIKCRANDAKTAGGGNNMTNAAAAATLQSCLPVPIATTEKNTFTQSKTSKKAALPLALMTWPVTSAESKAYDRFTQKCACLMKHAKEQEVSWLGIWFLHVRDKMKRLSGRNDSIILVEDTFPGWIDGPKVRDLVWQNEEVFISGLQQAGYSATPFTKDSLRQILVQRRV